VDNQSQSGVTALETLSSWEARSGARTAGCVGSEIALRYETSAPWLPKRKMPIIETNSGITLHSFSVFQFFVEGGLMAHTDTLIERATALIKDQRFIFRAGKKIGELGIVHENRNRLIIFLACLTMFLRDKVSVSAIAPSGSGKSTLIEIPLKVFPPESVVRRASFSRKALAFGQQSLDKKILYVNEYSGSSEARQMLRILQSEAN